jgi:hypothetical protein
MFFLAGLDRFRGFAAQDFLPSVLRPREDTFGS